MFPHEEGVHFQRDLLIPLVLNTLLMCKVSLFPMYHLLSFQQSHEFVFLFTFFFFLPMFCCLAESLQFFFSFCCLQSLLLIQTMLALVLKFAPLSENQRASCKREEYIVRSKKKSEVYVEVRKGNEKGER